jgi:hypothetical protein
LGWNNKRKRFSEAHVGITCPLVWFFSPKNSKQNLSIYI